MAHAIEVWLMGVKEDCELLIKHGFAGLPQVWQISLQTSSGGQYPGGWGQDPNRCYDAEDKAYSSSANLVEENGELLIRYQDGSGNSGTYRLIKRSEYTYDWGQKPINRYRIPRYLRSYADYGVHSERSNWYVVSRSSSFLIGQEPLKTGIYEYSWAYKSPPPCVWSRNGVGKFFVWDGESCPDEDGDGGPCDDLINPDGSCNCCAIGQRVLEILEAGLNGSP